MLKRVLIANRGEIAIRIARAAASLGIDSVAIFTAADSASLHTKLAGSARQIDGDPLRGYLDIDAVVAAAKASGADCVHPGYGFLSENAAFAERCAAEGLRFVGPSPASLKLFGDKVAARTFAEAQGIPVVPGAPKLGSAAQAKSVAASIGYPVMLKAAAGGGGRGMRAVAKLEEMDEAFARCQGEAEAAFGDRSVFLEKIVPRPRHIEVQVLGDGRGNVAHLFERDCSVQLRNQKVVEVAPAPNLDKALRQRILDDAVKLARAAAYENAGTVEFLVTPETDEHFFIECNPRIQVEHTITEQVMGVDLVEAQFRIAAGGSLPAIGTPRGFAIQARVVVQGTGTLSAYREPSGPGVRIDACGYLGLSPPPQFDPLLAKLICQSGSAGTFESAVERTQRALDEFHIVGVPTNREQLRAILAHHDFRAGNARTTLLADAIEAPKATGGALPFLDQQVAALGRGRATAGPPPARPMPVPPGHEAVESPHAGSIVEIKVGEGNAIKAGEPLFVVSAMKMETSVTAP
ncbi:MAG: ATP-grasp domain-containing protein, partial [Alphaproteobacteria bacterium]|nr:ATP-grasp domain-containing protein [Alphaproteobacteria bacterium]